MVVTTVVAEKQKQNKRKSQSFVNIQRASGLINHAQSQRLELAHVACPNVIGILATKFKQVHAVSGGVHYRESVCAYVIMLMLKLGALVPICIGAKLGALVPIRGNLIRKMSQFSGGTTVP